MPDSWPFTTEQARLATSFADFVQAEIAPYADEWDRREALPAGLVADLGRRGYLGATVPRHHGGGGFDNISLGLLHEAVGAGCTAVRSLLTVHGMVCRAIARWGNRAQQARWLPRLAAGETVAAFALTEPEAGSDIAAIRATARPAGPGFVLDGVKQWITYGGHADLFLVFARLAEGGDDATANREAAFLVSRETAGLAVEPVSGLLGARASHVAKVRFRGCRLPADSLIGRPGFGLAAVAADALELGRYSVAWGCVGLLRGCLDATVAYTQNRRQFGTRLRDQPLIQRMVADMATSLSAARLLCYRAGTLRQAGDPGAVHATWAAKYFAADRAFRSARDAVQCHGANGCSDSYPVQRYLRDAKIMEIIEGSTELQQTVIARGAYPTGSVPD
jgi:hypothetical protein